MKHRQEPYEYYLKVKIQEATSEIKDLLRNKKERDIHHCYTEMGVERPWGPEAESLLDHLDRRSEDEFYKLMEIQDEVGGPVQVNKFASAKDFAELKERFDVLLMELHYMGFSVTGHYRDFYWECRKRDEMKGARKAHPPESKVISDGSGGDRE